MSYRRFMLLILPVFILISIIFSFIISFRAGMLSIISLFLETVLFGIIVAEAVAINSKDNDNED